MVGTFVMTEFKSYKLFWNDLFFNSFHDTGVFYTPENLYFSDVIRGYRKRPGAWNGLRRYTMKLVSLFIFVCLLEMFFKTYFYGELKTLVLSITWIKKSELNFKRKISVKIRANPVSICMVKVNSNTIKRWNMFKVNNEDAPNDANGCVLVSLLLRIQ